MTSKCGKNKKVGHEAQPSVSLVFPPHIDVLCDLLLVAMLSKELWLVQIQNSKKLESSAVVIYASVL